jgi:dolichol-phosphate mannosyltransferase
MNAIVIPTYNEAGNLPNLIERLAPVRAEIIVVDDGSPDGTAEIAEQLGCTVLRRSSKQGLASAYALGLGYALDKGCERLVQMDADLSHRPEDVPMLLAAADHHDLVLGCRWMSGGGTQNWDTSRELLSRFGSAYARMWLGMRFRDLTGGFKCWRADTLRAVDLPTIRSEGYAFQVETTWRAHNLSARITEVPICFDERLSGASKMSIGIALEAAWVVPQLRWSQSSTSDEPA